jgi:hypothetical protein
VFLARARRHLGLSGSGARQQFSPEISGLCDHHLYLRLTPNPRNALPFLIPAPQPSRLLAAQRHIACGSAMQVCSTYQSVTRG